MCKAYVQHGLQVISIVLYKEDFAEFLMDH